VHIVVVVLNFLKQFDRFCSSNQDSFLEPWHFVPDLMQVLILKQTTHDYCSYDRFTQLWILIVKWNG
jgi:hypothetical protein